MNRIVQSALPLTVSSTDFSRQNSFDFLELNQELFLKKFTNLVMKNGKKNKASKIMFDTFTLLKRKIHLQGEKKQSGVSHESETSFSVFHLLSKALENVTPSLHVRKVRVSGSTYLVPAVLSKKKQETLALIWLLVAAKKRQKKTLDQRGGSSEKPRPTLRKTKRGMRAASEQPRKEAGARFSQCTNARKEGKRSCHYLPTSPLRPPL